jgi:hypothetical protein
MVKSAINPVFGLVGQTFLSNLQVGGSGTVRGP